MVKLIQKRLKNQKGFTLVELMVVVVIIGILVGIAVPAYNKVTANAEEKACAANRRTIEGAVQLYKADNSGTAYDQIDIDSLEPDYLTSVPECPSGGNYTIDSSNGTVTCDAVGHSDNDDNTDG